MPDPIPSCFRLAVGGAPPASTSSGPTVATSVYSTPLGPATLSWSRTVLGLLLRLDLPVPSDDDEDNVITLKIRPWLLFSRRGSRRFRRGPHRISLTWDLSRAKFPAAGGPEPSSSFFLSVAVDGEILLVAGDLAFKKSKISKNRDLDLDVEAFTSLISRKEHVTLKDDRRYETSARFGGKDRAISIDLAAGEMSLDLDGERFLHVRRLRWKFRGNERVDLEGGDRIQLSWDLHDWIFPAKSDSGAAAAASASALFVLRFEREGNGEGQFGNNNNKKEGCVGYKGVLEGYFGKKRNNWSESSSGCGEINHHNNNNGGSSGRRNRRKSFVKTSSFSSTSSSVSSAGGSTVMEWASAEENELRSRQGFSLVICLSKS